MIECESGRNIVTCDVTDIIIIDQDDENKEKRTDDISSWDADFLKVLPVPITTSQSHPTIPCF